MDEPFDRAFQIVADRVGDLGGMTFKLADVGDELPCDRVLGIAAVDQIGERRGQRHRIARADRGKLGPALGRGEPGGDEIGGRFQGAALGRAKGEDVLRFEQGLSLQCWCGRRGSNPHSLGPRDFKSLASTSFATSA